MKINFLPHIKSVSAELKSGINRILPAKNKLDCFEYSYKHLMYEKCNNLDEVHQFVALNFPNTSLNIKNISEGNRILRVMCRLYNMTKGKIEFPPLIKTYKSKHQRYVGEYSNGVVSINSTCSQIERTLAHEICHYNHELVSPNFDKMGKLSEMKSDGITDFSIFNKFQHDKRINLIRKYVRGYATSSPCEFVACTFEALANGRIMPIEIWELYKKYEGPFADMLKPFFAK